MSHPKIVEIDAAAWEEVVLHADRPVAVDFYSTECPPCEALAPKFEGLADLYGDDVTFVKIFRQGNRELATALGVTGSPTVLFYRGGEAVGERFTGGIHRADLQRNLDALVGEARAAEIHTQVPHTRSECDVLIVGAGPAGLTAAIYSAQARLDTVVLDRALAGGNLNLTHTISNFPGFPKPQPGYMMAHYLSEHAKAAGAHLREAVDVTRVDLEGHEIEIDGVETIHARKIILAMGSSPRPLGVENEKEYAGRGISYCATCDAKYYEGAHVVVIGGGNSAVEESLFIAKFAERVTLVHQFAELTANKQAQEAILGNPKFEFLFRHEPRSFVPRDGKIGGVVVEDLETGERRTIDCDGVFVFVGMQPNLAGVDDKLAHDAQGWLVVDEEMHTNIPDVFATGDVRTKRYRQMTTAVADGTIAAITVARELGA